MKLVRHTETSEIYGVKKERDFVTTLYKLDTNGNKIEDGYDVNFKVRYLTRIIRSSKLERD